MKPSFVVKHPTSYGYIRHGAGVKYIIWDNLVWCKPCSRFVNQLFILVGDFQVETEMKAH